MVVNGWSIFAHPALLAQLDRLIQSVETERRRSPADWSGSADAKVLAALRALIFRQVPADPTLALYRQGKTLGGQRKHWFRVKFAKGRFRLFFRYSSVEKIIIFAWVNDQNTLRTYGAATDAYRVFGNMLDAGNPPDSWKDLLAQAKKPGASTLLATLAHTVEEDQ